MNHKGNCFNRNGSPLFMLTNKLRLLSSGSTKGRGNKTKWLLLFLDL